MGEGIRWFGPGMLACALASAGCATGATETGLVPGPSPDAGDPGADAAELVDAGNKDAGPGFDASPDAQAQETADHLLLTEVVLSPTGAEYIELANLTGVTVDLASYYLSDTDQYMFTAGLGGAGPTPSMLISDFIAGFPSSPLADGATAVVAIDGDGFEVAYGAPADFCLTGSSCTHMIDIAIGSSPTLTNAGEPIALFYWDGVSDLVSDVDIVKAGTPSGTNPMPDKSGVVVDGPDADGSASSYASEASSMTGPSAAPGEGFSMKRLALESGSEQAGGNGRSGHDETSEDIAATWDDVASYTAPTPGLLPGSLVDP